MTPKMAQGIKAAVELMGVRGLASVALLVFAMATVVFSAV